MRVALPQIPQFYTLPPLLILIISKGSQGLWSAGKLPHDPAAIPVTRAALLLPVLLMLSTAARAINFVIIRLGVRLRRRRSLRPVYRAPLVTGSST